MQTSGQCQLEWAEGIFKQIEGGPGLKSVMAMGFKFLWLRVELVERLLSRTFSKNFGLKQEREYKYLKLL